MFTGIIENIGIIQDIKYKKGKEFSIKANFSNELKLGDSVSVNGVCQTVTAKFNDFFICYASEETLKVTNLNELNNNSKVNLERSLKLGDRLDGHFVYGHVDTTCILISKTSNNESFILKFKSPKNHKYIVNKGSIAINGISLTVYQKDLDSFKVMVIPHTYNNTNLKGIKVNNKVNIEFDVLSKYIESFKND